MDISLLILETQIIGQNQNIERFKANIAALQNVINKNASNKFIGQKLNAFIAQKEAEAFLQVGKKAPNFSSPVDGDYSLLLKKDEDIDVMRLWPNGVDGFRSWGGGILNAERSARINKQERFQSEWIPIER
mgnify:CR=1 FL=1